VAANSAFRDDFATRIGYVATQEWTWTEARRTNAQGTGFHGRSSHNERGAWKIQASNSASPGTRVDRMRPRLRKIHESKSFSRKVGLMQTTFIIEARSTQAGVRTVSGACLRATVCALLWMGILSTGRDAQAEGPRWKLKAGEVLRYVMQEKEVSTVKAAEGEIKSNRSTTTNLGWSVQGVSQSGDAEIALRFERIRVHIERPPYMPYDLDSSAAKIDAPEPFGSLGKQLKAMAQVEFTFKLKPNGAIEDFTIPEKTLKTLRAGITDPTAQNAPFEQALKDSFLQSSPPAFPENASEPGRTWTSKPAKIPTQFGNLIVDKTFTALGADPQNPAILRIGTETKVAIEPQENAGVSAKLQSQEGKGSLAFDTASGRILSTTLNQKMQLLIANPMDPNQKIDQTTETSSTMTLER
jgi:hypothetical protein